MEESTCADPRVLTVLGEERNLLKNGVTRLTDLAKEKIFGGELNSENQEEFDIFARRLTFLYYGMKDQFSNVFRDSGERYFEHLRGVVENVLNLPNPNVDKVYASMLHDAIEDKEKIDFNFIDIIAGNKVALSVQAISKNPWIDYLDEIITPEEEGYISEHGEDFKEFKLNPKLSTNTIFLKLKKRCSILRNNAYFSHIESFASMKAHISSLAESQGIGLTDEELNEVTQNTLDVKFADRIHNLSTQWSDNGIQKTKDKIEETRMYFLDVAQEINKDAYTKLQHEIFILETKLEAVSKKVETTVTQ